jgi:hypothetical protein
MKKKKKVSIDDRKEFNSVAGVLASALPSKQKSSDDPFEARAEKKAHTRNLKKILSKSRSENELQTKILHYVACHARPKWYQKLWHEIKLYCIQLILFIKLPFRRKHKQSL